jgi:hypothetical protein
VRWRSGGPDSPESRHPAVSRPPSAPWLVPSCPSCSAFLQSPSVFPHITSSASILGVEVSRFPRDSILGGFRLDLKNLLGPTVDATDSI